MRRFINTIFGVAVVVVVAAVATKVFAPSYFDNAVMPAINALIQK